MTEPRAQKTVELTLGRVALLFVISIFALVGMVVATLSLAAGGRNNTAHQIRTESKHQFLQGCSSGNVVRAGQLLIAQRIDDQQRLLSAIASKLDVKIPEQVPRGSPTSLVAILTGIPATDIRDCRQTVDHDNLPVPLSRLEQKQYLRIVQLSRTPQVVYDAQGNPHVR